MHTSYNLDSHRAAVRTIKGLAMDAVQAAESGHPGMPLGAADMATVLWSQFLKHDPKDPAWPDRDRFIAACAALVAAARRNLTDRKATLELDGGLLTIEWRESDDHVIMTGPTQLDFTGTLP